MAHDRSFSAARDRDGVGSGILRDGRGAHLDGVERDTWVGRRPRKPAHPIRPSGGIER